MKRALFGLLILAAALPVCAENAIRYDETQIEWKPGPATLPSGSQVAVLEGDPRAAGLFTMRVKLPAGARLFPHWHPKPERVTVLSGLIGIGYGDTWDPSLLHTFGPGSYYVTPPQLVHFALVPEETIVQITTEGPWELNPVNTPRKSP